MRSFFRSCASAAVVILGLCVIEGCRGSDTDDATRRGLGSTAIPAPANIRPDSLAIEIVNELNENLVYRTPLTPEQARAVAIKAAGALEIAKTELMLAADENAANYEDRIEVFADELVKGSLDALDELKDVHQRQLNKVLEEIVVSVMESMKGRTDHLDTQSLTDMLKLIAMGAMHHLDEAGYSMQSMAEGARTIAATAIGSLDDAGVLTTANGQEILIAIVSGTILGLAEGPVSVSTVTSEHAAYATVIDDLAYGAVGSLDDAGFSLAAIDDSLAHIMFAILGTLDELGLEPHERELVTEAALHGAIDALKREAGVTDPAQIEDALGFCVSGAVASLGHSRLKLEEMDEIIAFIVKKIVHHVDNLGVSEADMEKAMEEIVLSAIAALNDAGFSAEHIEAHGDVMADITVATMEGLVEVGFTSGEINTFLDDITESAFKPLVEHGFTKAQSQLIGSHFLTGLQTGLAASTELVLPYDQAVMSAHVLSALDAAYQTPAWR